MISLGIDHGNFSTKSSDNACYSSGFSVSAQPPIGGDKDCLEYNGMFYSIGASRPPVRHDKTQDEDTFILTLPALARAISMRDIRDEPFRLGVGLPMMAYADQKERFRKYFLDRGEVRFCWCGQDYRATIAEVSVYPQGYAAYLTQYNSLSTYDDVAHVDIGGYTVDLFCTHGGRLVEGSGTSIPGGTLTLAKTIGAELRRYDIRLSDDQIMQAIQGQKIEHRQHARIADAATTITAKYVRDIKNTLREHGIDTDAPINLIGGGCTLLGDRLRSMYVVGQADMCANAKGYQLWLARTAVVPHG